MKIHATRLLVFFLLVFSLPAHAQDTAKYWIYFTDKGPAALAKNSSAVQNAKSRLSTRAISRRAKVLGENNVVQFSDLALYSPYLSDLERHGIEPVQRSRWLNAVSAFLTEQQVAMLKNTNYVEKVVPVRKLAPPKPTTAPAAVHKNTAFDALKTSIDYGNSLQQNAQINVTALHDAGIYGENVIVGMLDSGFFTTNHVAF
mgnify:CR=1 FL=1